MRSAPWPARRRRLASEAKKDAASVAQAQKESESVFNQRFANRNKYAAVDTKSVFFDFNKADLKDDGINELREVAKALKADPNAVLELQGFADARGTDRYNYQLTRERVDCGGPLPRDERRCRSSSHCRGRHGQGGPDRRREGGQGHLRQERRVEMRLLAPQS